MADIVIALIDEGVDQASVEWGIARAGAGESRVRLVSELDASGSNPEKAKGFLADTAQRIQREAPGATVETTLVDGAMLRELLDRAESADLIVVGSHPEARLRDGQTPSLPVSLAARAPCPVVIVPDDWTPHPDGAVVLGIEAGGESSAAVAFAVREAGESGRELRLVHTWESWNALDTRAGHIEAGEVLRATAERVRAEAPGIRMQVVLEEAVAHEGVLSNSRDASLIVLGTHGIGRETGIVLGAIHLEVMIAGGVPLCVVPLR